MRLFVLLVVLVLASYQGWSQRLLSNEEVHQLKQALTELEQVLTIQATQLSDLKKNLTQAQTESETLKKQINELKTLLKEREMYWEQVVNKLETERNLATILGVVSFTVGVLVAVVR